MQASRPGTSNTGNQAQSSSPGAASLGARSGAPGKVKGKGKKSKGSAGERPPAGRKDTTATHAAACLRYLAAVPGFADELMGE